MTSPPSTWWQTLPPWWEPMRGALQSSLSPLMSACQLSETQSCRCSTPSCCSSPVLPSCCCSLVLPSCCCSPVLPCLAQCVAELVFLRIAEPTKQDFTSSLAAFKNDSSNPAGVLFLSLWQFVTSSIAWHDWCWQHQLCIVMHHLACS